MPKYQCYIGYDREYVKWNIRRRLDNRDYKPSLKIREQNGFDLG